MWSAALASVRAHRSSLAASFLAVLLGSALLAATGVILEAGVRANSRAGRVADGSMLITLASSFAGTAAIVVVLIVTATLAAALRQRREEFALLRAVGATRTQIHQMITAEVLVISVFAIPLGAVPGLFAARSLVPLLVANGIVPPGFTLGLSLWPVLGSIVVLLPTTLVAARLAAREAVRTSPTVAVSNSSVEPGSLSRARRITAVVTAVTGLLVAMTPFFTPGLIGSAVGSLSAFLLITAAALGGPALVSWAARRATRASVAVPSGSVTLAVANARGFSRRLTAAIIPLALLLALGTVQAGTSRAVVTALGVQLTDGLHADLVVNPPDGVTREQAAELDRLPGVVAAAGTAVVPASVQIDSDDEMFLQGLSWESTALRAVPANDDAHVIDPSVRAGSLSALSGPNTIAVSADATLGTGKGVGSTVEVRAGGAETTATIVAVYDRGLGFGDYLIGDGLLAAVGEHRGFDVLVVQAADGEASAVRERIEALGFEVDEIGAYVDRVTTASAAQQQLSSVLLLVLLAFIGIAAANTLVMLTGQRGAEFRLLRRTGATAWQVVLMSTVESVFVAGAAWAIGTLAVLPALVGVSFGLLGTALAAIDLSMYLALSVSVIGIAVLTIVVTTARTARIA